MMPLPVGKLVLLIPRLASEHDGEVIATVRAIQRTLATAKCDLHDLAQALSSPLPKQKPRPQPPPGGPGVFDASAVQKILNEATNLNEWEEDFLESILEQSRRWSRWTLSPKQRATLERIFKKTGMAP